MMHRFYSWSIRTHLTILIALLAIPSISLIVYSGIAERREAIAGAKAECLKFVNDVAGQQQAIVAGAEQLATALSLLPPIQAQNPAAANTLLAELLKKNPQYANIAVCDKSGLFWASAVPLEGKVSVADRRFFQEAVRTGMFSSGEYVMGRALKKGIMSFGYPVKNTAHELIAVIGITLDLDYAQQMFEKLNLPSNSSFSLLDQQGVILIRNLNLPSSKILIGGRDTREENFTKMTDPHEGTFEVLGNDGLYRLAAYKKISLPHESRPYLYVRSSIPLASATSKANAAMLRELSVFVSLFLIGLLLAWYIGKRIIVNPVMMLKEASKQLAAGADTVNVSHLVKGGELGALARTFDGMAEALVQRGVALRESEQRWATTLASIGDAVIATDVEGKIAFMNAVAEEMTGWTLRDASQKPVTEVFRIINEYARNEVENPVTKVLREGMIVGLANHTILIRKDGIEVPIDDSGAPIRDKDGKTMGVVLVFRDITERKRAEERTEHLASYPQLNPSPVIEVEVSGTITFSNPGSQAILEKLGLDRGDLKTLLPHDLDAILRDWDKKTESTLDREVTVAGRVFGETVNLVPQFKVARIYARDITEQKRAEEESQKLLVAVQEEKDRLSALINSIQDEIWFADTQKRFTLANPSALREFGLGAGNGIDVEKFAGSPEVYRPDGSPRPVDEAPPLRALRGEAVRNQEEMIRTPGSGELRHRQVSAAPVKDFSGTIIGSVSVVRDITDLKQAEEALQKAHDSLELRVEERTVQLSQAYEKLQREMSERERLEDQLRQAHKMQAIGTLAGGIAHDFNNILAAILGFTEMAADDVADRPEVGRNLQKVLKSAMRARELVKQILAFSRKTKYERTPLSLTPLINETVQFLRASIPATVEIRLAATASSDHILAAPVEMQQVLMNLATNASLAMQDKGGTLEISLTDIDFKPDSPVMEPDVMPGEYLQLMVKDTGIGMSPDVMKRVFEPFFTTREVGKGTGMGLAVVYGIVSDLQGTITVESAPGVGSTFRVLLPKIKTAIEKEHVPAVETPRGTERVLFVDDEQMLLEWGQATLERLGYSVVALTDSTEALRTFSSDPFRFDLVITDQTMSGMTGVQLAKELLTIRHDIPIILCTGHSEAVSPETAKDVGIRQFLMKPVAKQELAQAIRHVLDTNAEGCRIHRQDK